MPDGLASLSQLFSTIAKPAEAGLAGAGLVGNIMNEKSRSDELNYLKKQQDSAPNATELSKQVAAATQPLNQGLVQGVENQVQGSLAEQGLSQAPGIQASVLAQSLAPAQQQNQNTALQLVLKRLGLPEEYGQILLGGQAPNANLAPLLALLQKNNTPTNPTSDTGNFDVASLMKLFDVPGGTTAPTSTDNGWLGDSSTINFGGGQSV